MITRRCFLGSLGAAGMVGLLPGLSFSALASDRQKMLVLLLRGGLDGMYALAPYAEPYYARLRGPLAEAPAQVGNPHRLDGMFELHPALSFFAGLYARRQLLPVVAVAPPYRLRSHFEAQKCLENGTDRPDGASTGWLNRCVSIFNGSEGLALTTAMPLSLRGPAAATTWSPPLPVAVDADLLDRLEWLYSADPRLAESFATALKSLGTASTANAAGKNIQTGGRLAQIMAAAAVFMRAPNGPQIAFVEDGAYDSHSNQARQLQRKLSELDAGMKAFHDGAQSIWQDTVVVVITEFGRTAAVNGTGGTDHGTGSTMFLAGGAVRGGRIGGIWPGLAPSELNEGRDLRTTSDLRAVLKGVLVEHLRLPEAAIERVVFPASQRAYPMSGLFAPAMA